MSTETNPAVARRSALRQLLSSGQVGTQADLVRRLRDDGHPATQSTVSRDLKRLGARRIQRDDGQLAYHLRHGPAGPFPAEMVLAVEHNETTVVVRTRVGRAQAVGLELDAMREPAVLGTLAGDDTVLVVPRSVTMVGQLAGKLRRLAGLG